MSWPELDTSLFVLLNQTLANPVFDVVMPILTDFDYWRVPVILLLLLVLARARTDTRVGVLFAILAVVAADQISSSGIKPLVGRLRPFHVVEGTRQLVDAYNFSFPSSHAANTFAAGVFLALRFRRMRPILVLPVLVSYSRVYVGVHYPLDVLGGAALGAIIAAGFYGLERTLRGPIVSLFTRGKAPPERDPEESGDPEDSAG